MMEPPTHSMATVPTAEMNAITDGMPLTMARPMLRVSERRPELAILRPMSSAFTSRATVP